MKLEGKVAIITGATSGIGAASAILFASEGAKVVVVGRNRERGESVVSQIEQDGGKATFVMVDLFNPNDMDALIKTTIETYGKIDILFNNAGIEISKPLQDFKDDDFDAVIHANLKAPFQMCKKAMPFIMETKGTILNTASISGIVPHSQGYAYNPSKSGLISLTKVLAKDYAGKGVRVNAICPGITQTPFLGAASKEQMAYLNNSIPMLRAGKPMEIAKAALFLVSEDASYITGAVLVVDGGITLRS